MDFETTVEWVDKYPGRMHGQNGMVVDYSPPVELEGMKGPMTPEDAFIGAANMCYQIVFQYVSAGLGLKVLGFRCRVVGDFQTVEGVKKFVKLRLYPEIRLASGSKMENLEKAIITTKRKCLVTNSMSLEVEIIPKVLQ